MLNKGTPISKPAPSALPALLLIGACIILAGMDVTAKYLAALGVPVLMVVWGRYFFHTVVTFIVYVAAKRSLSFLHSRRPKLQLIRAGALFIATSCFYVAITKMQLADAAAIQFLAPVLVTAFSGLFLGERVGFRRWSAVAVAFAGVIVVARPGSGAIGVWGLLPLVTTMLLAIYLILTRMVRIGENPDATTFYTTAVGAVVLSAAVMSDWQALNDFQWGLMLLMGSAGALGHFLLVRAFHEAEASVLAPFTYSQVVGAIIWGYIVFGDVPSPWTFLGTSMIMGSGIYVWYREMTISGRAS